MFRRYSTFDPRKWVAAHTSSPLSSVLAHYKALPPSHQQNVAAIANKNLKSNFRLASLLQENAPPQTVFQHVVDSLESGLSHDLVENFLFSLVAQNNLNAATALVHTLRHADDSRALSNEFWALFSSRALAASNSAAVALVYHEIVSPYKAHLRRNPFEENEHVPFLMLPTAIEAFAVFFAQEGNVAAVQGLKSYFRRFYSCFGHRSVYETLCLAEVEAISKNNDFRAALKAYVKLARKFRGHMKYRDPKAAAHSLLYASSRNAKQRLENVANNWQTPLYGGDEPAPAPEARAFAPKVLYNNYRLRNGPYWAIFDGHLEPCLLPNFHALLRKNIEGFLEQSSIVTRLVSFISSKHHSLGRFVTRSLCELGYTLEAIAVVNRMLSLYPQMYENTRSGASSEFKCIFAGIKEMASQDAKNRHKLLMDTFALCQTLHKRPMTYSCFHSFVSAYLASSLADADELGRILGSWNSASPQVCLGKDDYDRAVALGVGPLFSCIT